MSSIVFRTPLTSEEQSVYGNKFVQLDKEDLGVVTGEALRPVFAASGLSAQILSQIWSMVDINNKGFLNKQEFSAAMRIIGNLQQNPSLPINSQLYEQPPKVLPNLDQTQTQNLASTSTPTSNIPIPSHNDIAKFSQLFDRTANGSQRLPGDAAKEIFLKARLPVQTLGEIWALCDRNTAGSLDKTEFIMAMYLIQLSMTNHPSLTPFPASLSPQLWQAINVTASATVASPSTQVPLSNHSTGNSTQPLQRQSTISRLSSGAFSNASSDWSLSQEQKKQFDMIFDALDKNHQGSLGSQVLVPFFLSSRLNQDTLANVWDLADIHNNAEFTKLEFAIAMFLIQKKNSGIDLPDVIPNELLNSPALGLFNNNNNNNNATVQSQLPSPPPQQQQQMQVPSRSTKPSFQDTNTQNPVQPQIPQNSNNGSLNDLLGLNNSFSSPPPQQQQQQHVLRNDTNNSFTNSSSPIKSTPPAVPTHSSMNMKKFNPTSNFGQNIIKEDEEYNAPPPLQQHNQMQNLQQKSISPVQRSASVSLPQVPDFSSLGMPSVQSPLNNMNKSATAGSGFGFSNNNDLFADGEASAQLSTATTDLANLSNQVNSLSKQASITNDKKSRAVQELKRVNDMKASIESKLSTLRKTHDSNVKETESLESQLVQSNKQTESLKQQLAVTEANYHAIESKLNELTEQLSTSQETNNTLKEQITNLNSMMATLQSQLNEKQTHVKQERSMVDVNSKQLELNQITVGNLQKEINGLDEKLKIYLTKQNELNEYQKTIEDQHAQLQSKYTSLDEKNNDLNERELQLNDRNNQIEEQEKIYNDHVQQLNKMFDELSERKKKFDLANEDLERQHLEYANSVQELAERQMTLAMGELPEDAKEIIQTKNEKTVSKFVDDTIIDNNDTNNDEEELDENDEEIKTEKTISDVFDRDIPNVGSTSEGGDAINSVAGEPVPSTGQTNQHTDEEAAQTLADRFEGDLNEYGIPRTQSLTSSVANNAPQSVRGETEVPTTLEDKLNGVTLDTPSLPVANVPTTATSEKTEIQDLTQKEESDLATPTAATTAEEKTLEEPYVPGGWEDANEQVQKPAAIGNDIPVVTEPTNIESDNESDNSIEKSPDLTEAQAFPSEQQKHPVNEEFPPMQELPVEESDSSSSSDDEFEDTREIASPTVPTLTAPIQRTLEQDSQYEEKHVQPKKDAFDDEFANLEEAAVEEEEDEPTKEDVEHNNAQSLTEGKDDLDGEGFETIEHQDLDTELQQNAFTGSLTTEASPIITSQPQAESQGFPVGYPNQLTQASQNATQNVSNDEWDEIFAGFGNSNNGAANANQTKNIAVTQPLSQPPIVNNSSNPVNRKIATTPKSLAIEELSGMGFSEEEATNALKKCNWDLDAATNFLLDGA
ncbi:Ede1p NDAI_0J00530 [Naumovozyma dairenensis CBS 421]|uniref:Actin cytoskeleton-regulatory complex protein PAN1 n=1 Tax=Naumovozyma dairenensis (strain ATCC 10597 / BCRC 20456 / CBS 421 / NBRC 0211 / NRRL Y-12639) TaxID=1071378 RepID=G0WGL7_NAUDC|nr:hypothetical protein NDAI_0J00530 [Naumovozyma dairenensis CBS 421]CCD26945.1 hypothetical protein NDAI_0J00530 [Naumovozyma dairenensis CBS 421]